MCLGQATKKAEEVWIENMYKILVTDSINVQGLQSLYEHPSILVDKKDHLSSTELREIIGNYDALIVRSQTIVSKELIHSAHRLQIIARAGVGVDNIDVEAATRKGIIVINAPGANTIAACEHTLAMLLSLARRIPHAYQSMSKRMVNGIEMLLKALSYMKKHLVLLGWGRLETEVAKRGKKLPNENFRV